MKEKLPFEFQCGNYHLLEAGTLQLMAIFDSDKSAGHKIQGTSIFSLIKGRSCLC